MIRGGGGRGRLHTTLASMLGAPFHDSDYL